MKEIWGNKLMWLVSVISGAVTYQWSPDDIRELLTVTVIGLAVAGGIFVKLYYIKKTGKWPGEKRDRTTCENEDPD